MQFSNHFKEISCFDKKYLDSILKMACILNPMMYNICIWEDGIVLTLTRLALAMDWISHFFNFYYSVVFLTTTIIFTYNSTLIFFSMYFIDKLLQNYYVLNYPPNTLVIFSAQLSLQLYSSYLYLNIYCHTQIENI